jgi:hypothetical protein
MIVIDIKGNPLFCNRILSRTELTEKVRTVTMHRPIYMKMTHHNKHTTLISTQHTLN